jgi:pimeloyl-ACP methyl ester carboxylesterase
MSQGGFLSLRAALTAPERVAGLFLIDTQAGIENPNSIPIYRAMLEEWAVKGPQAHVEDAIAAAILGGSMDAEPWKAKWRAMPIESIREAFDTLCEREDLTDRLGEITCPAVVVHGDADASIPMSLAEALAAGLPNCRKLVTVPGGGHASNLSHPHEVNAALDEFLESIDPSS